MNRKGLEQLLGLAVLLTLSSLAAWDAVDFRGQAKTFPYVAGLAVAALVGLEGVLTLRRPPAPAPDNAEKDAGEGINEKADTLSAQFLRVYPYILWLLGLYLAIYFIGMALACALFVFLFTWRLGKLPWYGALGAGLGTLLFLVLLTDVMNLRWPDSVFDPLGWIGISL